MADKLGGVQPGEFFANDGIAFTGRGFESRAIEDGDPAPSCGNQVLLSQCQRGHGDSEDGMSPAALGEPLTRSKSR